jgi:hypothetical protein
LAKVYLTFCSLSRKWIKAHFYLDDSKLIDLKKNKIKNLIKNQKLPPALAGDK